MCQESIVPRFDHTEIYNQIDLHTADLTKAESQVEPASADPRRGSAGSDVGAAIAGRTMEVRCFSRKQPTLFGESVVVFQENNPPFLGSL